jgi:hypothetical protein
MVIYRFIFLLFRCVAKYLEVHERIGNKLTELSMKDQEFQQRVSGAMPTPGS